jgi:hypothetical protein
MMPDIESMNLIHHISRSKISGIGRHHCVLLSDDRVVDLTADRNVQMTTLEGFASGKEVISEKAISSPSEIHKTVYRLRKAYRRQAPYNLIFNNCESFARGAVGEPEVSWQIVALCVVAGVIVLSQARV